LYKEKTFSALKKTADKMKKYADRKHSDTPEYEIGDKVWLYSGDIQQNQLL
jgi:hypothetical protein